MELDEIQVIMRDNIEKVIERDIKIVNLESKSEDLVDSADRFKKTSRRLRNQMWWQDKRMILLLVLIIVIVLVIIIVPVAVHKSDDK
jgi:vesicle-associated membrane protein 4